MKDSGNGASFSLGGEPGGKAPLLGTPKDVLRKVLEMSICFHGGPILGNIGGRPFLRAFKRGVKFLFIGRTFIEELERHVKEGSGNGQLSP